MAKKKVVQKHHVRYSNPEWTVPIFRGEHYAISLLARYTKKDISDGLITALLQFVQDNRGRAIKLGEEEKK